MIGQFAYGVKIVESPQWFGLHHIAIKLPLPPGARRGTIITKRVHYKPSIYDIIVTIKYITVQLVTYASDAMERRARHMGPAAPPARARADHAGVRGAAAARAHPRRGDCATHTHTIQY